MKKPNLSVAWDADAQASPIGNAKEPPQRQVPLKTSPATTPDETIARLVNAAQDAFKYDWRARLRDFNPVSHPKMRYDLYREDKDKLFAAVKILCATPFVHSNRASDRVIAAFWRLREAATNRNLYNRETNQGMDDARLDGEHMKALLELAMTVPKNTTLRRALESAWFHGTMDRDTDRTGWQLRRDMEYGLKGAIPGSDEAGLYEQALLRLLRRDRSTRVKTSGLHLVTD